MIPSIAIFLVFLGCCTNVVFLELLVKDHPGCGNIVTLAQFLFIAVEGFIFTTKFGRVKNIVPLNQYAVLVTMFFLVSVVNNYALGFNIAMPLHMIFRAGSLIANLILGVIILKRRYKFSKYLSVVLITIGIAICTVASGKDVQFTESRISEDSVFQYVIWGIGIFLLTFALFMSARMGIYQETLYAQYGKHPNEALFYSHALPLPGFLLLSSNIYQHVILFNQSEPILVPPLDVGIPKMWLYLLGNVLTQYVCIRSVFVLTTECTSLTVTLVVTLRKFVSLLFSIWYFRNPFTPEHWVGTGMVFVGTMIFIDIANMASQLMTSKKKSKKQE